MKFKLALIVALSLVLFIITASFPVPSRKPTEIACTMDAKICPDGTAVGRSGPMCEFAECPGTVSEKPVPPAWPAEAKGIVVGETVTMQGIAITPQEILEDSRCPSDVVCIQAGQVRVKTILEAGTTTQEAILSLPGEPVLFANTAISLASVLPYFTSTETKTPSAYRFVFVVEPKK